MATLNGVKLTKKCRIVLKHLSESAHVPVPTHTVGEKDTPRRKSARLLQNTRRSYKECSVRVWKKIRKISMIKQDQPNDKSFDTTNGDDQLAEELTVLSNLDANAEPELSTPGPILTTQTNLILDSGFRLDEIDDLPLDLSINKVKATGSERNPKVIIYAPLDLSIKKTNLSGEETTSQTSSPNLCTCGNDLMESANSLMIPHAPASISLARCSSNELVDSNTVVTATLNQDLNPSANPMIVDSIHKITPITKDDDSAIQSKKRKMNGQSKQNYRRGRPMQRENCPQLKAQLAMPAAIGLLELQNSSVAMQKMVRRLPSATTTYVASTIKNWPNELILHFYFTCVKKLHMCFRIYFSVVCNMFAERRMINRLVATVKDCEQLSNEHYFKIIFEALIQSGMKPDLSLLLLCVNSNRSLASNQVILEIMCSSNLSNFERSAVFISTQIGNFEISPMLANMILEKAGADSPLNTVILNFCFTIVQRSMENQNDKKVIEFLAKKMLKLNTLFPHL